MYFQPNFGLFSAFFSTKTKPMFIGVNLEGSFRWCILTGLSKIWVKDHVICAVEHISFRLMCNMACGEIFCTQNFIARFQIFLSVF